MGFVLEAPFIPRTRRDAAEVLDDPRCDPGLRERSLHDVARANRLLGGTRAVLAEMRTAWRTLAALGRPATLLDVGTGIGDIPARVRTAAARHGVTLVPVGLDGAPTLAATAARALGAAVCGSALALPVASRSVDVVLCSQLLHHFDGGDARRVIAEMHRVARERVVISDLRRSWLAASGLWAMSFPMGFHPVSRADGMLSVLKGFTARELATLIGDATGTRVRVTERLGWRLTASWSPRA